MKGYIHLIIFILALNPKANAQVGVECGTEPDTSALVSAPSNCDIGSLSHKCVKLRFHYINNTADTIKENLEYKWAHQLRYVNEVFAPTKIRFTTGSDCINKIQKYPGYGYEDWRIEKNNNHASLGMDPNGIDVFVFQDQPEERHAHSGVGEKSAIYLYENDWDLAHELGHALGLYHTQQNGGHISLTECKDGRECDDRGDYMCDTGADPWLEDLDGINGDDEGQWVVNCVQMIDSLVADPCGDITTQWNIPFNNVMSYYNCGEEFSDCQIVKMHNDISGARENMHLADCATDPYNFPSCPDIIIDTDVLWLNGIKKMCPGQKIIITSTGRLRLENYTITYDIDNIQGCEKLYKQLARWDGIHIDGGSFGILYDLNGNAIAGSTGAIIAKNSTIEQSLKGIQAPKNFGEIFLDNVVMRENGVAINAHETRQHGMVGNPGSNSSVIGRVVVLNSTISADNVFPHNKYYPPAGKQISVVGTSCLIKHTQISNNTGRKMTGVYSFDGTLQVIGGSSISNFQFGIYKDIDAGNPFASRGMFVLESEMSECDTAIINFSEFATVRENVVEGDVISIGICEGEWTANHFKNDVWIANAEETNMIEENKFVGGTLHLMGDNSRTLALCNIFEASTNHAVLASFDSDLPMAWGSPTMESGNIWEQVVSKMEKEDGTGITNYELPIAKYQFDYRGQFSGELVTNPNVSHCSYDLYPEEIGDGVEVVPSYELPALNADYQNLEQQINLLSQSLTGNYITDKYVLENMERLSIEQGLLSGRALKSMKTFHTIADQVLWQNRASPQIKYRDKVISGFYLKNWQYLLNYLSEIEVSSPYEGLDRNNLYQAIEYMRELDITGTDIYNLSCHEKGVLIELGRASGGNHTAFIRGFLQAYYDIYIPTPKYTEPQSLSATRKNDKDKLDKMVKILTVFPNPADDRVVIRLSNSKECINQLRIYNVNGRLMDAYDNVGNSKEVDVFTYAKGFYIVQIVDDLGDCKIERMIIR